jgi:hypothetical protein
VISDMTGNNLFCNLEDIKMVLQQRLPKKKQMLDDALKALETGFKSVK